jgi:tRNA 2-thiouridine synthesizing protein A
VDYARHRAYLPAMPRIQDTLDATGLLCPLPVLKARKRLKALAPGEVLEMIADDPAAIVDVPHFCAEAGHDLVSQAEEDGRQTYLIRKGS